VLAKQLLYHLSITPAFLGVILERGSLVYALASIHLNPIYAS
jgi:hypothetical protein